MQLRVTPAGSGDTRTPSSSTRQGKRWGRAASLCVTESEVRLEEFQASRICCFSLGRRFFEIVAFGKVVKETLLTLWKQTCLFQLAACHWCWTFPNSSCSVSEKLLLQCMIFEISCSTSNVGEKKKRLSHFSQACKLYASTSKMIYFYFIFSIYIPWCAWNLFFVSRAVAGGQ